MRYGVLAVKDNGTRSLVSAADGEPVEWPTWEDATEAAKTFNRELAVPGGTMVRWTFKPTTLDVRRRDADRAAETVAAGGGSWARERGLSD